MPIAAPPPPEESRIAGVWIIPEVNAVLVKHLNGAVVQVRCVETGLVADLSDHKIHDWQQIWAPPSTEEADT